MVARNTTINNQKIRRNIEDGSLKTRKSLSLFKKKRDFVSHRYNFPFRKYSQFRAFSFRPLTHRNHGNPATVNGGCREQPASFYYARRYRRTRFEGKNWVTRFSMDTRPTTYVFSMARSKLRKTLPISILLPIFLLY